MRKINRLVGLLSFILLINHVQAKEQKDTYNNPILSGFYPDPSICRVGDDYYMVNSSFEWFPGIPIHHSKDLINWEQIGNVLDRPSQLNMKQGMKASAGVWAPTIRYIKGKYYVIVTAKQCGNTFYVSSENPKGPWSEPTYLPKAPGIDPSLFCDNDGTVWICANDKYKPDEMGKGQTSNEFIWLQRIDLDKGELYGERYRLTHGLTMNSPATEGPHIYKVNGLYYLLTAEGMTWNNHAVAVFKSKNITGPYKACNNGKPVVTHRDLPHYGGCITTTGHADLIQTQTGDWWAVMLAVRPMEGMSLLGRETFICPVQWINDEPKFGENNNGQLSLSGQRPDLPRHSCKQVERRDDFEQNELGLYWNFLRTPHEKWYKLQNSELILKLRPERVEDLVNPSLIARRVQHHKFVVETCMKFSPQTDNEEAGLIIMQNSTNFYKLVVVQENQNSLVRLIKSDKRNNAVYQIIKSDLIPLGDIVLGIEGNNLEYKFYYQINNGKGDITKIYVSEKEDASICSSNCAGGFTGSYIGMYASSNASISQNVASFDWFDYYSK